MKKCWFVQQLKIKIKPEPLSQFNPSYFVPLFFNKIKLNIFGRSKCFMHKGSMLLRHFERHASKCDKLP